MKRYQSSGGGDLDKEKRAGMRLTFDTCFDSGAFPGPLAGRDAVVGELWVGPHQLLGVMETALGLSGPTLSAPERAAALVPALRDLDGFWRKSFENDHFATAATLLHWRDTLRLHGWQGQSVRPRLKQLASATREALPGYPDRLAEVAEALLVRNAGIGSVTRLKPLEDLPKLWKTVFDRLAAQGTEVVDVDLAPADAAGNLAGARSDGFAPVEEDHSLQLLRTAGPLEAAERVAAHLAGLDDLAGTVIVGADSVLDAALRRYGLPTTGSPQIAGGNALLQIMPLVLACGWAPADPQRVLELLTLPESPVPRGVAGRLGDALHAWPAVGSDDWLEAKTEGLAQMEDAERRARVERRLDTIFTPAADVGQPYPSTAIRLRLDMLVEWLNGRRGHADVGEAAWDAAIAQCGMLGRLLDLADLAELSVHQLKKLVEQATVEAPALPPYDSQAGLTHVGDPGAVAGPVKRIVWWGFTHEAAPSVERLPLSMAERDALADAGVELPDLGMCAVAGAERWRRPLMQARDALILVCPKKGYDGKDVYPHPLWDEIVGNLAGGKESIAALICGEVAPEGRLRKASRTLVPLPAAQRSWRTKRKIPRRKQESPSGAGDLIGCPLKWVLNYVCHVGGGMTATLPGDSTLWGNLVHYIVAESMKTAFVSATKAEARAGKLFDELAPRMAATLFQPGSEAERTTVKRAAALGARKLHEILSASGASVVASEQEFTGPGLGGRVLAYPDLVVDSPRRIIDLKWRGYTFRSNSLAKGTAYQLATCGHVARGKGEEILPGAYLILANRRLITTAGDAFPGATVIDGPSAAETWAAFERAYAARHEALAAGEVTAEAIEDDDGNGPPDAGIDDEGKMLLEPPCGFCDFQGLCGYCYQGTP